MNKLSLRKFFAILGIIAFFNTSISADIMTQYRNNGIQSIEHNLDLKLTQKKYWKQYLRNKNVDYGYYETIQNIILSEKSTKTLKLFVNKKFQLKQVFQSSSYLGEVDGDKYVEGDLKTPIGAYDLTKKITKLDDFYGPLALVTSYPNTYDKYLNKNGSGIWIHGMPEDERREEFTKGCIALENNKIKELDTFIDIQDSILLVSGMPFQKVSKHDIATIFQELYTWIYHWKYSNTQQYLSFYDKQFQRFDGMRIDEFKRYKTRIFNKDEKKTIIFNNINIIPYPNSQGKKLFRVVMDEYYRTKSYKFIGKKELYLELKNDKISIILEG